MSISYKFFLNKRRRHTQGIYPVRLKIGQSSAAKELGLGISIPEGDWDEISQSVKNSCSQHNDHNARIFTIKSQLQKLIQEDELAQGLKLSLDEITDIVLPHRRKQEKPQECFLKYGEGLKDAFLTAGKAGNALVYINTLKRLRRYVGKDMLLFNELTYKFLDDYNNYLLGCGLKVNGISIHMRTIRAIYNKAIKEGLANYNDYPFKLFKIKNERTINRTLTIEELRAIIELPLTPNENAWHWRNVFLLSFYLIGMNMADLLTIKPENIIDGRVVFRRKKTHKIYSIKIQSAAQDILFYYKSGLSGSPEEYILPILKTGLAPLILRKTILQQVHNCNNYLKEFAKQCKIPKPVSTYYARYSWANIARKLGYSKDIIAEALGHEYGNKVTGIYLEDYDKEVVDEVNQRVIEHLLNL